MLGWLLVFVCVFSWSKGKELITNGGFESWMSQWDCWEMHCDPTNEGHSGQHSVKATGRHHPWESPSQYVAVQPGRRYDVSAYFKLLSDAGKSHTVQFQIQLYYPDGKTGDITAAQMTDVTVSAGWIHVHGSFSRPSDVALTKARVYFQIVDPSVTYLMDDVSINDVGDADAYMRNTSDQEIRRLRTSPIHVRVSTPGHISKSDVVILVTQKKKSFPFGTSVRSPVYTKGRVNKYRDFIHNNFNWAVPEWYLKWRMMEPTRGQIDFQPALDLINGLRAHGLKVRGHNLVWSKAEFIPGWVKQLSGQELRQVVLQHIQDTMNATRGLLEHWDVNNENLPDHGKWYQDRLHDPDYNLELFRIAHRADPSVKLFLNDYSVVNADESTDEYLRQAQRFKAANVGLYGMGVQCHFGDERMPDPHAIKRRLDTLAKAGLPIWATELDVGAADENRRADYYEHALRAVYAHPAVEGILMWGFWDQQHWRGEKGALVRGDDLQLTAAGRRVLDLYNNQWMTDESHVLSQSGDNFTVQGFHGEYEVRVLYQGKELSNLKKTFTLGKGDYTVSINVHT
ncbi:uncharacterized protein [Littorina saxatilis]|uniref:GH10 domain-containing protein n=1 Tax=Littorina saxatilis TaxID=31220 RepID=A0AAN9BKL7_9CAEN